MNDSTAATASADLKALAAAELAAAVAPLQSSLASVASGDGSTASVIGAWISLRGQFVAALPALQKIGINNVAGDLNQLITSWVAAKTAELTAPAAAAEAPAAPVAGA